MKLKDEIKTQVPAEGLNRTRVELKYACDDVLEIQARGLNRTRVELKYRHLHEIRTHGIQFESHQSGIEIA